MPSFSIPLTGLESDNTELNTIANNLANMSTTGFKSQTTDFSTLFYQQLGTNGADDPLEVGSGVGVAATETEFGAGAITTTTNATDMALSGDGFFVVQDEGNTLLTRAGDFSVTNAGDLVTANGASVMGFPATNGVVNTNASLVPIALPVGQTQAAQSTSQVSFTANLDATATVGTVVPATISIYDTLGVPHIVTATMIKTAQNSWSYSIAIPAADTGTGPGSAPSNNTGTFTFDSNGNLASTTPNIASPGTPVTLGAAGAAQTPPSPTGLANITFPGLTDGAAPLKFNLQIETSTGGSLITQVAGASGVTDSSQNGFKSGIYNGFTVASDGTLSAKYSNGETTAVGQIAVGNVVNQQGLVQVGANAYETTLSSGVAAIGIAGSGSNGTIQSDSLEGSNVDISAEFSNLIVAQRAFEANSKSITTFDTITQETINMIH